jgi:hypothetical protein
MDDHAKTHRALDELVQWVEEAADQRETFDSFLTGIKGVVARRGRFLSTRVETERGDRLAVSEYNTEDLARERFLSTTEV